MDVEIKLNFGASQIERAKEVFGLDPARADKRDIYFGEVRSGQEGRDALPLLRRGVILRVRATKKKSGDVTLKLRGPDGCLDGAAWSTRTTGLTDEVKLEGDWADRRLVSASLTADSEGAGREDLAAGVPPIATLLSKEQTDLATDLLVPVGDVELLGPISALKWKHERDGDVDAEEWRVGDLHFLEVSVLATTDPEEAQRALRQRAVAADLTPEEGQEPKTTRVLRHLAGPAR